MRVYGGMNSKGTAALSLILGELTVVFQFSSSHSLFFLAQDARRSFDICCEQSFFKKMQLLV